MTTLRGKSLSAVAWDIAEGYVTVNPIFLKPIDVEALKSLYNQIVKVQKAIRGEKFPHGNINMIRARNIRLQRLHSSLMVMRTFAKERGMRHLL